jgi:diguanylate cyclase (GGDEF)-like protein
MKILVAEDEAVSLRLIETMLGRWGYEVVAVRDGLEALRLLQQPDAPQLAILDWMMPGLDGIELCKQIRQNRSEPYTYILLLTGKNTRYDMIEGLDAGADDYVVKPYDPQELQVRLRTGKRILFLQEQLIAAREAMREQATHDALTGLYNRAAAIELLTKELARQQRHGASVGVVLVDLDSFKQINDQYGHLIGDQVLQEAAQAMLKCVRPYDFIGRFGGEEFIVALPGCDLMNAVSHAERMRAALEQVRIHWPTGSVSVTASFGVTVALPGIDADVIQLIRAADDALYRAKRNGRNRVEFAEEPAELSCGR